MDRPPLRIVLAVVVAIAILSTVAYLALDLNGTVHLSNPPTRFTVNGHTFVITAIASDRSSREAGLMNQAVTNSTAMLFVFPSAGVYPFWMSGVNSSLDIIWLRMEGDFGHVVYMARDVLPCPASTSCPNYTPSSPASWVLEVKGGFSNLYSVDVGSQLLFT